MSEFGDHVHLLIFSFLFTVQSFLLRTKTYDCKGISPLVRSSQITVPKAAARVLCTMTSAYLLIGLVKWVYKGTLRA